MKIRNATPKDKRDISELYYELHPVEEKERREKGFLVPIEKEELKGILLVAEENEQVVGFIWGHFIVYGFFQYGTIDEMFVDRKYRCQGIGKALVKTILRRFSDLNVKLVLAGTEKKNREAIELFKKAGFELGKESLWLYWNPKRTNL